MHPHPEPRANEAPADRSSSDLSVDDAQSLSGTSLDGNTLGEGIPPAGGQPDSSIASSTENPPDQTGAWLPSPARSQAPAAQPDLTLDDAGSVRRVPDDQTLGDDSRAALSQDDRTLDYSAEAPADDQTGAWAADLGGRGSDGDQDTAALTLGMPAQDRGKKSATSDEPKVDVPGYEILGELGRGGMGVVYKARQHGLNRIVALKMVLAGSHAGAEQLARFRIEAEAVADLQHPNIVQVYEIKEHDGCPFFSLEFIDGPSLQQQIDNTPQPPREAAGLMQSLAEAMYAAHQRGIIHRDLKPANILLAPKGNGTTTHQSPLTTTNQPTPPPLSDFVPKITDFGLAKRFEDKDEGHTRTGAIMGTPSYMAPEQAQGRTKETGPPADIYSLGAMFYDLLTGRPPFRGATLLDTLQQVQAVEPVPPARLQPNLPRDLETICLKCLEKDPQKRYLTAGALADDLRRYLAGEPILARPTPWWERTVKWARRRPALAALVGVSVLAVISLLTLGGLWLDSERRTAEERETAALERERLQTEQAQKEKALRERAETNFLRAKQAVDLMLSRVGQDTLAHVPQMTAIRKELLENALGFYEQFRKEKSDDPAVRWEGSRAQQRVADIYQKLGKPDSAAKAYEQSLASLAELAGTYPQRLEYRKDLAGGYNNFGNLLKDIKQSKKAEQFYRQAMKVREELFEAAPRLPEHTQELAESFNNLGIILQTLGKMKEAEPAYRRGAELLRKLKAEFPKTPRYREELARNLSNQGTLLKLLGKTAPAEKCFAEAQKLWIGLVQEDANIPEYRRQLALTQNHFGDLWRDTRATDAEKAYGKALVERQQLTRDFPTVPAYAEDWATSFDGLTTLLQSLGRDKEADQAREQAVSIRTKIVADHPKLPEFAVNLAASLKTRGFALYRQSRLQEAEDSFDKALKICERLHHAHADVPRYQQELADTLLHQAVLYQTTGRGQAAEKAITKSLHLSQELAQRFPDVPEHQQELAQAYSNRGAILQATAQPAEIEKAFARAADIFADLASKFPDNPDYRHSLAAGRNNQGNALRALGRLKEAEKAWQAARDLLSRLTEDHPAVPTYRRELAQNLNEIGVYLVDAKRHAEAEKVWNAARDLRKKLADEFPDQVEYRLDLARSLGNLGILLAAMKEVKKAEESFRRGVTLLEEWEPKLPVTPVYSEELIREYRNLAELHAGLNRPAEAEKSLVRVLALQEKLVKAFPKSPEFRYHLSSNLNEIGSQFMQRDRFDDARKHLESAADHLHAVLNINAKDATARQFLYFTDLNLATAYHGLGDHRRAAKTVTDAGAFVIAQQPMFERFAAILAGCSALAKKDGKLASEDAKKLPQAYAAQAMDLLTRAVKTGFKDAKFLKGEAFDPVRERADFQNLLRQIEAGARQPAGPAAPTRQGKS